MHELIRKRYAFGLVLSLVYNTCNSLGSGKLKRRQACILDRREAKPNLTPPSVTPG